MNSQVTRYCVQGVGAVFLGFALLILILVRQASAQLSEVPPTWGATSGIVPG